jgi:outer membrane protein OmpA-like peptidoglycan-associated protein
MKKKMAFIAALLMGGAATAQAWDLADVRKDNKQIFVPFHQQSGWYYPDQPASVAPREKKQDTFAELESNLTEAKVTRKGNVINVTFSDTLMFDVGSSTLKPGAEKELASLANALQRSPKTRVKVEGHTDSTGDATLNKDLSERRAQVVAAVLQNKGVASSRLHHAGFGASRPVANNDTEEGRRRNRRVEVQLTK